ncbi:uncharacterized protein N7515_003773 [Penicillium bovifimosum]|uniref:Uncharacterized protein n=1 Tax=Penicillium bovifimosum TaxID=126998 RepID=A0A9W9H5C0_9EURO|nr:uncharacterized protein N7515_003773 [Penicillium bovifimosum]KAJ5138925.1 hypothetical protein N7515_003773 [Penicillium bovifimosum]
MRAGLSRMNQVSPQFLVFIDLYKLLVCSVCRYVLMGNDPLTHIFAHDPTLRGNTAMLDYLRSVIAQRLPIEDTYRAIQLASPIDPLPGLATPFVGRRCKFDGCASVFASHPSIEKHLREILKVHGTSAELGAYIGKPFIQGLQKNRFFEVLQVQAATPALNPILGSQRPLPDTESSLSHPTAILAGPRADQSL